MRSALIRRWIEQLQATVFQIWRLFRSVTVRPMIHCYVTHYSPFNSDTQFSCWLLEKVTHRQQGVSGHVHVLQRNVSVEFLQPMWPSCAKTAPGPHNPRAISLLSASGAPFFVTRLFSSWNIPQPSPSIDLANSPQYNYTFCWRTGELTSSWRVLGSWAKQGTGNYCCYFVTRGSSCWTMHCGWLCSSLFVSWFPWHAGIMWVQCAGPVE